MQQSLFHGIVCGFRCRSPSSSCSHARFASFSHIFPLMPYPGAQPRNIPGLIVIFHVQGGHHNSWGKSLGCNSSSRPFQRNQCWFTGQSWNAWPVGNKWGFDINGGFHKCGDPKMDGLSWKILFSIAAAVHRLVNQCSKSFN